MPSELVPFPIITNLTVLLNTLPQPVGQIVPGPNRFFAQAVFNASRGSWGAGLALSAPTSTFSALPRRTWQAGPAAAIIYPGIHHLVLGGVFQNPINVQVGPHRSSNTALSFTPSITYTLPRGWFAGYLTTAER
jgi:hypothetical protein